MSLNYATRAIAQITNAAGAAGTAITVATGQGARFINGAQERRARLYAVDTGAVEHVTITNRGTDTLTVTRNVDAGGAQTIAASGWIIEDIDDIGPWHAIAYDGGFFAAVGGGTWTVQAGDVLVQRWRRIGFTVEYEVTLSATSIAGTVSQLNILLPTAAAATVSDRSGPHPCIIFDNSATVAVAGWVSILSGTNTFLIQRADGANFAASTNNTIVSIMVKVQVA